MYFFLAFNMFGLQSPYFLITTFNFSFLIVCITYVTLKYKTENEWVGE